MVKCGLIFGEEEDEEDEETRTRRTGTRKARM